MRKTLRVLCLGTMGLLLLAACDTALTVGTKTVGIRSGEFVYSDGYLRATYTFPLEEVWQASEKALAEMKASDMERIRKIAEGHLRAMIQDEKVRIDLTYLDRVNTSVAVMAGTTGNTLASQLIHDRILRILQAR